MENHDVNPTEQRDPLGRDEETDDPENAQAFSMGELKRSILESISDEVVAEKFPMKVYHCEDCGSRIAARILNGPSEPMPHHYLSAGGGEAFLGCCPICGGTMFHDLSLSLKGDSCPF